MGDDVKKEVWSVGKMVVTAAATTMITLPIAQSLQKKVLFGHVMGAIGKVTDAILWIVPNR